MDPRTSRQTRSISTILVDEVGCHRSARTRAEGGRSLEEPRLRTVIPMDSNRFGLTRSSLGRKIKTEVRRRCAFGCVVCGNAITTYEHFDPPFAEAKSHDPDGITLLCGHHQLASMKGILSKETIAAANKYPMCKQNGFANDLFDLGSTFPILIAGTTQFIDCGSAFKICGDPYIWVTRAEKHSRLFRLSAKFTDRAGRILCEIKENELRVNVATYDFEQIARRYTITDAGGEIVLALELEPPRALCIRKCNLETPRGTISVEGDLIHVRSRNGSSISLQACTIYNSKTGINPHSPDDATIFGALEAVSA
jgi:hypothetical protein